MVERMLVPEKPPGKRTAKAGPRRAPTAHRSEAVCGPAASSPGEEAGRQEKECRALLALLREAGAATTDRRYDRGDTIYREDEPGDALYILTRGMAKLVMPYSRDKEATLRLLGSWDAFGYPVFGAGPTRRVRAEAVTPCEVVKVPKVFAERAIRRSPEAALQLTALLGLELTRHEEWIVCLLPYKVEAKLANLLLLLARRFGRETDAGAAVLPRLTHEELAGMVASTRESVTHALNDLRRRGVLGWERGRIVVLEPDRLAEVGRRAPFDRSLAPAFQTRCGGRR